MFDDNTANDAPDSQQGTYQSTDNTAASPDAFTTKQQRDGHIVVSLAPDEYERTVAITTEQTEYIQLAGASASVYNAIRNVLIGSTFLYSGLINVVFQPRFPLLNNYCVYFYYLSCYTAIASVIVLVSPAMWQIFGKPVETQLSLLKRAKIVIPTGMILVLISILSMLGVQTYVVFESVGISIALPVSLLGLVGMFWFALPFATASFKPYGLYRQHLYKRGHYFSN